MVNGKASPGTWGPQADPASTSRWWQVSQVEFSIILHAVFENMPQPIRQRTLHTSFLVRKISLKKKSSICKERPFFLILAHPLCANNFPVPKFCFPKIHVWCFSSHEWSWTLCVPCLGGGDQGFLSPKACFGFQKDGALEGQGPWGPPRPLPHTPSISTTR